MERMLSRSIKYTLPPNLWYTFDGRPLRGFEVKKSGKKLENVAIANALQLRAARRWAASSCNAYPL